MQVKRFLKILSTLRFLFMFSPLTFQPRQISTRCTANHICIEFYMYLACTHYNYFQWIKFFFLFQDKHWLVRSGLSPLPSSVVTSLDQIYRRRWETLLSLDELVSNVHTQLKTKKLLDDTYIIFTSDNGFHIGNHSFHYIFVIIQSYSNE